MTADLADALKSQIYRCWSPPVGAPNANDLVVDFDLQLNPDGTVAAGKFADSCRAPAAIPIPAPPPRRRAVPSINASPTSCRPTAIANGAKSTRCASIRAR